MVEKFHDHLYKIIDEYIHLVYKFSRKLPKEELFGSVSQWRRSSMSVMLNYQEGFARRKKLVKINFYEISFGSCKESRYLSNFSYKENWITKEEFEELDAKSQEIASMLWKTIEGLEKT